MDPQTAFDGQTPIGEAKTVPLKGRWRQWLAWFARHQPGFWQGEPFRLIPMLSAAKRTGRESFTQRRRTLRQRIDLLENAGVLVWSANAEYRLAPGLQPKTGRSMASTPISTLNNTVMAD